MYRGFSQSFQVFSEAVTRIGDDHFHLNPRQFNIHQPFLCCLDTESVVKQPTRRNAFIEQIISCLSARNLILLSLFVIEQLNIAVTDIVEACRRSQVEILHVLLQCASHTAHSAMLPYRFSVPRRTLALHLRKQPETPVYIDTLNAWFGILESPGNITYGFNDFIQ
jgi:hypothetical protein